MTRIQVDCRSCHRSLEGQSRLEAYVLTEQDWVWGPIGPICSTCAEFAVSRRKGPMSLRQINPDGTMEMSAWPDPGVK